LFGNREFFEQPSKSFLVLLVCQLPATFRLILPKFSATPNAGVDDSVDVRVTREDSGLTAGKFDAHSIHWRVGPEI